VRENDFAAGGCFKAAPEPASAQPGSPGLADARTRRRAGFWRQLLAFTCRGFIQQYRPFSMVLVDCPGRPAGAFKRPQRFPI
jgi:hypothetical protein